MRCFEHIAKLIRTKRINHPKGYSQSELSHLLGYKNGQFISNVERALCNIPLKMLGKVSEVLDTTSDDLKQAILKDHDKTLDNYLSVSREASREATAAETTEEVLPFAATGATDWRQAG
jgi:transcriptional regulator with XRE-family HTH domain